MATISIHYQDVDTLVTGLADIHELQTIDLGNWPELRYVLANLVGTLRERYPLTSIAEPISPRKRIDLELLMAQKFTEWEGERLEDASGGKSADDVLKFYLAISDRGSDHFVRGLGASSSVTSFRVALDNSAAWNNYEVQLCESTNNELADLTLEDMAHCLVLAGGCAQP